jgi:isopentenyl-diphosphate delta-isomerase
LDEDGGMPGAKHAARRKLGHELGIPADQVPHEDFRYLGRFHYWAADTLTYGPEAPWGEHEVDYILFFQGDVTMTPNPDEVDEAIYVTPAELRSMLQDESLRWSPWFIGIMDRGGWDWWGRLEEALRKDGPLAKEEIIYFDPPPAHHAAYNLASHDRSTGIRQLAEWPAETVSAPTVKA